jgi:hypothetical protein
LVNELGRPKASRTGLNPAAALVASLARGEASSRRVRIGSRDVGIVPLRGVRLGASHTRNGLSTKLSRITRAVGPLPVEPDVTAGTEEIDRLAATNCLDWGASQIASAPATSFFGIFNRSDPKAFAAFTLLIIKPLGTFRIHPIETSARWRCRAVCGVCT